MCFSMGRHDLVQLAGRKDVTGQLPPVPLASACADVLIHTAFPDTFDTPKEVTV